VILHYKTCYFGKTCAETWNFSLPKKLDLRKTKLFRNRPSSFCSTYPNICDRTKRMDISSAPKLFIGPCRTDGSLYTLGYPKDGIHFFQPSSHITSCINLSIFRYFYTVFLLILWCGWLHVIMSIYDCRFQHLFTNMLDQMMHKYTFISCCLSIIHAINMEWVKQIWQPVR
jgi:hypothetical protein